MIDWSLIDECLLTHMVAGRKANACSLCHSLNHEATFCHLAEEKSSEPQDFQHQSYTPCLKFNSPAGCSHRACRYAHICSTCRSSSHSKLACKVKQSKQFLHRKWLNSPINTQRLETELAHHPEETFVMNLLRGIQEGFDIGIREHPQYIWEVKNLKSALANSEFVTEAITSVVHGQRLHGRALSKITLRSLLHQSNRCRRGEIFEEEVAHLRPFISPWW